MLVIRDNRDLLPKSGLPNIGGILAVGTGSLRLGVLCPHGRSDKDWSEWIIISLIWAPVGGVLMVLDLRLRTIFLRPHGISDDELWSERSLLAFVRDTLWTESDDILSLEATALPLVSVDTCCNLICRCTDVPAMKQNYNCLMKTYTFTYIFM